MSYKFNVQHRHNGSWYISKPYDSHISKFFHYKMVIEYINTFSKFLDDEVFKDCIICDRLNSGSSWSDISEYIEGCKFNDEITSSIINVYNDGQEWIDRWNKEDPIIGNVDIRRIKELIYSTDDTNNVDVDRRKSYNRILQLLEIQEEFKKL